MFSQLALAAPLSTAEAKSVRKTRIQLLSSNNIQTRISSAWRINRFYLGTYSQAFLIYGSTAWFPNFKQLSFVEMCLLG